MPLAAGTLAQSQVWQLEPASSRQGAEIAVQATQQVETPCKGCLKAMVYQAGKLKMVTPITLRLIHKNKS